MIQLTVSWKVFVLYVDGVEIFDFLSDGLYNWMKGNMQDTILLMIFDDYF